MDKFDLSVAPSVGSFVACRRNAARKLPVGKGATLILGYPGKSKEDLFYVSKEATSIKRTYPNSVIRFGAQAKEAVLDSDGSAWGVIHLACHADSGGDSLASRLFLAAGQGKNGQLEAREAYGLNLSNCALVMLSACASGRNAQRREPEETSEFDEAFMQAGSPRVISSLWRVDDLATAVLAKRFYRNLKAGDAPALALRRAQQTVRNRINAHPAYWAGFQLAGEPR